MATIGRGRIPKVFVLAGFTAVLMAQSASESPAFDTTSVKLNVNCGGPGRGSGGAPSPGRITLECAELRDLILTAYGIYADGGNASPRSFRMQVVGGPGWVDSERYDIAARAEGNPAASQIYGPMLRGLLEERFRLKVHRETREEPVYFLTVARGGAKMPRVQEGSCVAADINHPPPQEEPGQGRPRACGSQANGANGTFDFYGASMSAFATQLAIRMDRDVIDKTGLAGMFDIHLDVTRADFLPRAVAGGEAGQEPSAAAPASDSAGPSIFTAIQKLGLKLESAKGPVDVLVIDRIEKPSAN